MSSLPDNWRDVRAAVMRADVYVCRWCVSRATKVSRVDQDLPFIPSNLVSLCQTCYGVHQGQLKTTRKTPSTRRPGDVPNAHEWADRVDLVIKRDESCQWVESKHICGSTEDLKVDQMTGDWNYDVNAMRALCGAHYERRKVESPDVPEELEDNVSTPSKRPHPGNIESG